MQNACLKPRSTVASSFKSRSSSSHVVRNADFDANQMIDDLECFPKDITVEYGIVGTP